MQQALVHEKETPGQFFFSSAELEDFNANGFSGPFTVMDSEEMKADWKRERIKLFDRRNVVYSEAEPGSGVYDYDRHLDNPFLADLICRPEIVDKVVSILGPDVLCWRSEFFPKYPGDEGSQWHQADTFGGLGGGIPHIVWPTAEDFGGAVTVWVAFTEADLETACMQFMPGTTRTMFYDESKGMHYDPTRVIKHDEDSVRRGFFGYDWREIQKDPNWKPDESKAVAVPCHAGQFVIFWSTTMHASYPHAGKSDQMRLAFAIRYVPTSVAIYKDTDRINELGGTFSLEKYGAVLVSGRDDYKHNRIRTHTTTGKPFTNVHPR